ncbi:MAG: Uma2 family endonuclease, partial [Cyanobacteria bacterium J06638_22]
GEKKDTYATQVRVPEYFWYDPMNPEDWAGFRLQGGEYQAIAPEGDRLVSQSLGLSLTRWTGSFNGIEATWLRWADLRGNLLLTAEEQERQRADQEHQRADQERQRAESAELQVQQIVRNLLQSGMTAEQVAAATGLSSEQIDQWRTTQN